MATEPARTPISEGYTGMLALTVLAMVIGIGLLVMEATDYDWEQKPKSAAAIALPGAVPSTKAPGTSAADVPAPTIAKQDEPKPELKPEVAVKPSAPVVAPAPVVAATPAPTGPTPSPLLTPQPAAVPAATPAPKPAVPVAPTPSPLILPFGR